MKTHLMMILFAAMVSVGAVCAEDKGATTPTSTTKPATATAVNKFCAVEQENPVDAKVTYTYNDKVIGFCCSDCIDKFKKDPDKYLKTMK